MKPCLTSSRSWMMSGRSRLRAYENVVNQKPGRSSSVIAAPPTRWRRSRIERPQPGLGQVGAVDQAVVAATDDDRVVGPVGLRPALAWRVWLASSGRFGMSGGPSLGVEERQPGHVRVDVLVAVVDRQLELDRASPGADRSSGTRASAMWRWSIGEYIWLVA